MNLPGSLFMDAPQHDSFEELITLAQDRKGWKKHWLKLGAQHPAPPKKTNQSRYKTRQATKQPPTTTLSARPTKFTSAHPAIKKSVKNQAKTYRECETITAFLHPTTEQAKKTWKKAKAKKAKKKVHDHP